jgi:hypothetical protein
MDRITAWSDYTGVLSQVSYSDEAVEVVRAAIVSGDVIEVASRQRHVPVGSAGCFWYELECDARQIRLHFSNREGAGSLGPRRRARRFAELRDALGAAQHAAPQANRVRGGSWLYNFPGYRAPFPASFLARAVAADPRTAIDGGSLWGQFLRGDGTLYRPHTEPFVEAIEHATTTTDLFDAFPLRRLNIVGPVHEITEWLATKTDEHHTHTHTDQHK